MNINKRISEIIVQEATAISAIKITPEFEKAILALKDFNGKVLTTGMGKAGYVAQRFATTLCSCSALPDTLYTRSDQSFGSVHS